MSLFRRYGIVRADVVCVAETHRYLCYGNQLDDAYALDRISGYPIVHRDIENGRSTSLTMIGSRGSAGTTGRRKGERGQAIVEFAFASLIALTLILAVVDFGRALFAYDLAVNAARLGTRYAVVRGTGCRPRTLPTPCPATVSDIKSFIVAQSPGIDATVLSSGISVNYGPVPQAPATNCTASHPDPGCWVAVTVSYPFRFLLPFRNLTFTNTSQMTISQ